MNQLSSLCHPRSHSRQSVITPPSALPLPAVRHPIAIRALPLPAVRHPIAIRALLSAVRHPIAMRAVHIVHPVHYVHQVHKSAPTRSPRQPITTEYKSL